jgi:hypothetical protein
LRSLAKLLKLNPNQWVSWKLPTPRKLLQAHHHLMATLQSRQHIESGRTSCDCSRDCTNKDGRHSTEQSCFASTTQTNDVLHRVSWKLLHTTYPSSTVDGDLATPPTHRIRTNVVRFCSRDCSTNLDGSARHRAVVYCRRRIAAYTWTSSPANPRAKSLVCINDCPEGADDLLPKDDSRNQTRTIR